MTERASAMAQSVLRQALQSHKAGDHARAEQLYKEVLKTEPQNFDALYRLGFLCGESGRFGEAEYFIGEAIKLEPGASDAHFLRGSALLSLHRLKEAVACFDQTLALNGDFPEALLNRAAALFRLRRYAQAAEDYGRLLKLDPDYPFARGNRLFCRLHLCDWTLRDEEIAAVAAALRNGQRVIAPFDAKALSLTPEEELRCASIWTADQAPHLPAPLSTGEPYRHDRIRVAYLAANFGDDPVSSLIAGVIDNHDRQRFEVTGVLLRAGNNGPMQANLRRSFERFIDGTTWTDLELASVLRTLEIDIAVDLMGFTEGCRPGVLAARPAPVQASYLGFPGTLGAPYMDYILADRIVIPKDHKRHYSEKIVTLPNSYQCNDSRRRIAERTPARAEAGLPARGFVFASFNNTYKITPQLFDIWMRLLSAVKGSVLWLPKSNALAIGNLSREAETRGIASDRLVFAPFVPAADEHLARLRLSDLFLDTLPYNAHTTASDALWAGVPVLTCMGGTFAGRVAASLLHGVGLPEMVAHSLADYEALALKLAGDPAALSAVRAKLAENRKTSSLFDTVGFTRDLEAAYRTMWERCERGEAPSSFAVGGRA